MLLIIIYHTKPKDGQPEAVHALHSHTRSMLFSGGSESMLIMYPLLKYKCGRVRPLE